jgi:hypothetical protein
LSAIMIESGGTDEPITLYEETTIASVKRTDLADPVLRIVQRVL